MIVFVIADNLSHEREVSLHSEKCPVGAFRKRGHMMTEAGVNTNPIFQLLGDEGPVAIPVLYGKLDRDGALREVLWVLGVPFVDSGDASFRRTFDKSMAIRSVGATGLATPQQVALPGNVFRELGAQAMMSAPGGRIGFPPMVKPVRSGSAFGTVKADSAGDLPAALVGALTYGRNVVVEEFVGSMGLPVTILEDGTGPRALPPVETRPASGVYDYESRYTVGTTRFLTPGELPDGVLEMAEDLAIRAHRVLGHHDISCTDMIVREGVPVFLKSNVTPDLTDTSLTSLALEVVGLDMGEVFSILVERACHRGH